MKAHSFKVSNTGKAGTARARGNKSPAKGSKASIHAIKHTASGANVPAAYAHEQAVISRISNRLMHVKPKGGWR